MIQKEIQGFLHHDCFDIVPAGPRVLPGIWIFSQKRDGTPKARFCVGGHRQILGRDYFEHQNYASVLANRDNRILLSLAAAEHWHIYSTDIVQAFLFGKLDDADIYINPPYNYPCPPGHVLKLKKAIYGLHQAPVKFKKEVTEWFRTNGYIAANAGQTIWIKRSQKGVIIHAQYADDFLHFVSSKELYVEFREAFRKRFDLKTGEADVYLGNKISYDLKQQKVQIDQSSYVQDVLERFGMKNCSQVSTPMVSRLSANDAGVKLSQPEHAQYRNCIGSLLYLACWTRPDISFAVAELSRFVSAPCAKHWEAAKHLMRYIKGTESFGLTYRRPIATGGIEKANQLWGYVDSDWAGCPDSRKSTSGYVLMLNGAAISWKSKKQSVTALSSAEAEFISASSLVQEVIYVRQLLEKLGFPQGEPTLIFEDNRTCIAWAEGAVAGSDKAKHIDLREHFVHEAVEKKILTLVSVASAENAADILTKPLPRVAISNLRRKILGL